MYACLLGGRSKWRCLQEASCKGPRLLVDVRRWNDHAGIYIIHLISVQIIYLHIIIIITIVIVTDGIHSLNNFPFNTMQSFGSQEWDAGFAVQALLAANLNDEIEPALAKGHDFIKKSQVCLILMTNI